MYAKTIFEIPATLLNFNGEKEKYFFSRLARIRQDIQQAFKERTAFPTQYNKELILLKEVYLAFLKDFKEYSKNLSDKIMRMPESREEAVSYFNSSEFTDEQRKRLIAFAARFYLYGYVSIYLGEDVDYFNMVKPLLLKLNYCLG